MKDLKRRFSLTANDIGRSNPSEAFDQRKEYDTPTEAVDAYRENVYDVAIEYRVDTGDADNAFAAHVKALFGIRIQ